VRVNRRSVAGQLPVRPGGCTERLSCPDEARAVHIQNVAQDPLSEGERITSDRYYACITGLGVIVPAKVCWRATASATLLLPAEPYDRIREFEFSAEETVPQSER